MSLFKKKITEQEAASSFALHIVKETQDEWPAIYKKLKDSFKEKFIIEDEKRAALDLALAVIALDLQAVKNLFPKDQAERIEKWVFKSIDVTDWGEYAVTEVKKYGEEFQKDILNINGGDSLNGDPLSAISAHLLRRWLGKNIQNFNVTGFVNPLLLLIITTHLAFLSGNWKRIKHNFKIVAGDIPLVENQRGLKDYQPMHKSDGTIQHYDEKMNETLNKGGSKKVYKVLIKGPWDGIKEADSTLFADDISVHVDDKGIAYAFCAYEEGVPKYYTIKKELWERWEEVLLINMNSNLSEEQRIEAINKLTKK